MTRLPKEEQRQFERLLQQHKVGNIAARLWLWEVFLSLDSHHVTVNELYQQLRSKGWNWGVDLVMDTLEMLVSYGLAARSYLDGLTPLYEPRRLEDDHHDHLYCMRCGRITEFFSPKLEELQETIIREQGFHPLSHRLVVRGICNDCLNARQKPVPLSQCGQGEEVVVEEVAGDYAPQLQDLGIISGARLKIISQNKKNMVVALGNSRLALSSQWCQQIMVRQKTQTHNAC